MRWFGLLVAVVMVSGAVCVSVSYAITPKELNERIAACNKTLMNMTESKNSRIPKVLLSRCKGIAIFPNVLKASVVFGLSLGNGVVLKRGEKDQAWSKPAFFSIRGGSIGVQAGAEYFDLILLFMNEAGIEGLLEDKYTLGADIAVSAGPISRKVSKDTTTRFDSGILTYSQTKGFFAGISVKGTALKPDSEANTAFYGKGVSVQDILYDGVEGTSEESQTLVQKLTDLSKQIPK